MQHTHIACVWTLLHVLHCHLAVPHVMISGGDCMGAQQPGVGIPSLPWLFSLNTSIQTEFLGSLESSFQVEHSDMFRVSKRVFARSATAKRRATDGAGHVGCLMECHPSNVQREQMCMHHMAWKHNGYSMHTCGSCLVFHDYVCMGIMNGLVVHTSCKCASNTWVVGRRPTID